MSRMQQDQFVDDDEEECCPLCVEEFDLSDRNFRPCPCGYQICQFCYNNIKTTMNGLCPACRRPYDDSTIEWKTISPEEMAQHKQQIAQKAKKNAQMRQKEAQKAEADSLSRKHLSGLRVVQKNLVYVTGLQPTVREDELLKTLRGDDYFGQYGKILKIVVSKAKENAQHQQSVGVYVTFARKEDAERCIVAVDGSHNGDRVLRAQFGTTKYCSAYLRGETCNNRNCMFLHEPGEDNDSFTRQDLSMMNSIQTQQPSQSSTSRPAPPAHQGPPVAAATPMHRQDSTDTSSSIHDTPGLPATANWGSKALLERRASRSTIASNNASPMVTNAVPAQASKAPKPAEVPRKKGKEKEKEKEREKEKEKEKDKDKEKEKDKDTEKSPQAPKSTTSQSTSSSAPTSTTRLSKPRNKDFPDLLKIICSPDFKFVFSSAVLSEEELKAVTEFPQLLDPNGGAKRRAMKEKEKELAALREAEAEAKAASQQQAPAAEREDTEATAGGSLQLGGEPEDGPETSSNHLNQHAIAPPSQQGFGGSLFGQNTPLAEDFSSLGLSNRGLTPQQQQQILLSNFKSGTQSTGLLSNMQNAQAQQHGMTGNASGHNRHTSRFSFANDSASASANVQPVANQKLMNQQNSMMPKNANQFNPMSQHQPLGGQFFTNVQGPPPGLKPTGTPPVSGTGMFGQGHGFNTGGLPYGSGANARNNSDAMYQDLLRSRNMDGGARLADAGKHDVTLNAEEQASINVDALVNDSDNELIRGMPMTAMSSHFLGYPRRSTPTIPPGFTAPVVPKPFAEDSRAQPASRSMSRTTSSNITPAVPVVPVTPIRTSTPGKAAKGRQKGDTAETTTPAATPAAAPIPHSQPTTPPRVSASKEAVVAPQTPTEPTPREASRKVKGETETPMATAGARKSTSGKATKDAPKTKNASKKTQSQVQTTPKKEVSKEPAQTTGAVVTPISSTNRQPPGKLDIVAATKVPTDGGSPGVGPGKADTQTKNDRAVQASATSSVPPSPAALAFGSPIKRTGPPRTLRVVATPKTEVPPPLSATSAPSLPLIPTVDKLRSRQASIASVNLPGTPASELISDTASITSTSFSRANSPPPVAGKVGTAPVRKKTKSQAKKDRQERKKQIEEEQLEDKSDVEVVQAPIIGRKKKAKKPSNNPKPVPAVAKSRPVSPKPATVEEEHDEVPVVTAQKTSSVKASAAVTPEPEPDHEDAKEKREYTAQAIMADLQRTGELIASNLEFFKPLSSSLTHTCRNVQSGSAAAPPDLKLHFSEGDLETLAKKKPLRVNSQGGKSDSRTLITPGGKFFWGLSEELEAKALDLEKRIDELKSNARFHARKPTPHGHGLTGQTNDVLPAIATALKEAGKKLNTNDGQQMPRLDGSSGLPGSTSLPLPPVQGQDASGPQVPASQQQQTPADAGGYLNQYVLPRTDNPPPNQPRPEMAAVGGPPGAGTANISVNANKFAKAAKAVVEGGAVGSTEIDGMGFMAADKLGGVFVQGLEALVGAGLGYQSPHEFGLDSNGNIRLGHGGGGLDMQGLLNAIETTAGMGGYSGNARRGRGSVLTMEEAEQAMQAARKEHDILEKKLSVLIKKNRKLALGAAR